MTIQTRHSKQQKEIARKRGVSLRHKTEQLGRMANIRTLTMYEDPTHGVWRIVKHCPANMEFPDLNRLVEEYNVTGREPRVLPCWPNHTKPRVGERRPLPRRGHFSSQRNIIKFSVEKSQNINAMDDDTATISVRSTDSECESADQRDTRAVGGMDVNGDECEGQTPECNLDNNEAAADHMIRLQLEETGLQAHQRLLQWIWGRW